MATLAKFALTAASALFSPIACETYVALAIFLAAVLVFGDRARTGFRVCLTPSFRSDLLYTLLVVGGAYQAIQTPLVGWIISNIRSTASSFDLDLLGNIPEPFKLAAFVAALDFLHYWKHRAMHAVPALWAFHRVHHSAKTLNFLTNYRLHLVDYLIDGLVTVIPLILLGTPAPMWWPVFFLFTWATALQHSNIDWTYGRFGRVFVAPRFHAVHHSSDPSSHNKNFAAMLSIWDQVFGSALFAEAMPQQFGLVDDNLRESVADQFLQPLRLLFDEK